MNFTDPPVCIDKKKDLFFKEIKIQAEEKRILQEKEKKIELSYDPSFVGLNVGGKAPNPRISMKKVTDRQNIKTAVTDQELVC